MDRYKLLCRLDKDQLWASKPQHALKTWTSRGHRTQQLLDLNLVFDERGADFVCLNDLHFGGKRECITISDFLRYFYGIKVRSRHFYRKVGKSTTFWYLVVYIDIFMVLVSKRCNRKLVSTVRWWDCFDLESKKIIIIIIISFVVGCFGPANMPQIEFNANICSMPFGLSKLRNLSGCKISANYISLC